MQLTSMKTRKLILTILVLLLTKAVAVSASQASPSATIYYVSSSDGLDSYNGLSESTPLATVSKVNSLNLQPGDQVLFKCGDVWRADPLLVVKSGTVNQPILFSSYPADCQNQPILSGAQPIYGWSAYSGNIFIADLNAVENAGKFGYGINQLFRGTERLILGRWPNIDTVDGGYSTIDSQPASNQIADTQLPAVNWNGAVAHIKGMRWYILNRQVTGTSGQTLTLGSSTGCWGSSCVGWGFFLNNHLNTLDQDGEWYYDSGTNRVYLYSVSGLPADAAIEGSVILEGDDRSWGGITLGADLADPVAYVTIQNFAVIRWYRHGIATPTNLHPTENHDIILEDNTIQDVDGIGINLATWVWGAEDGRPDGWRGGYNHIISSNLIERANRMGINTYGRNSTFSNNIVLDIGLIGNLGAAGMGCDFDDGEGQCTEDGAGIRIKIDQPDDSGNYNIFSENRLERIGHNGMDVFGHHNTFEHNVIRDACISKGDCGGVRTFGRDSLASSPVHDLTFTENIIVDTLGNTDGCHSDYDALFGFGLYLDNYSRDVAVTGNTIINTTVHGILFQRSTGSVTDNTLYNNGRTYPYAAGQVYVGSSPAYVGTHTGNILYSLNSDARTLSAADLSRLGTSNNNYFFSPYLANHIRTASTDRSLASWQSYSGKDSASVEHWFTLSSGDPPKSRIFYNDTPQVKIISLGGYQYEDLDQNLVSGSLILQPYRSRVLIQIGFDGDIYLPLIMR